MKKTIKASALCAALLYAAVSCQMAEPESATTGRGTGIPVIVTASLEDDGYLPVDGEEMVPETKTWRNGTAVWWNPGDEFSLFFGPANVAGGCKFTCTLEAPAKKGDFSGEIDVVTGGSEGDISDFYFWGVYPYSTANTCVGSSVTLPLPAVQESGEDTFSNGQWPTVAKSANLFLSFMNVGCGYKFSVSKEGIQKVVVTTGDINRPLAGQLTVVTDAKGKPMITSVSNPSSSVTVTPPGGGTFKASTDEKTYYYYVSMIPGNFKEGVQVQFYKSDMVATYVCSVSDANKEYPSQRGAFKRMEFKDKDLKFRSPDYAYLPAGFDFYTALHDILGEAAADVITFETSVDRPGTDISTDGNPIYMSYDETAKTVHVQTGVSKFIADEDCGFMFADLTVKEIRGLGNIDFSETRDFGSMLWHCKNLVSFDLAGVDMSSADNIDDMFDFCESLTSIDFSGKNMPGVTSLAGVFSHCHALETIDLSKAVFGVVTDISEAFYACRYVETIDLSSISTPSDGVVAENTFWRCLNLNEIYFGAGLHFGADEDSSFQMFGSFYSTSQDYRAGNNDIDGDGYFATIHCTEEQRDALVNLGTEVIYADLYRFVVKYSILPGEFSVSATEKVHFSPGNLRYNTVTKVWVFFDHQYDCGPSTYEGGHDKEISLFTWGFSPEISVIPDTYRPGCSLDIPFLTYADDWGRMIEPFGTWRTLTADEWKYLVCYGSSYTNATREGLYAYNVTVAGMPNCLVLYPDGWKGSIVSNGDTTSYDTASEWALAEAAGAVCLPAAGWRKHDSRWLIDQYATAGFYWSSTRASTGYAYCIMWGNLSPSVVNIRNDAPVSVRLVTK